MAFEMHLTITGIAESRSRWIIGVSRQPRWVISRRLGRRAAARASVERYVRFRRAEVHGLRGLELRVTER